MTTFTTEDRVKASGTCGCGRSPTGDCCGWHSLTEEEFREKLAIYEAEQDKFNKSLKSE
jgi:hypothetical protein